MDKLSDYIKTFDNLLSLDDCDYMLDWFHENDLNREKTKVC